MFVHAGKLTTPVLREKTQLWELFGPGSWLLFHLIGVEGKEFTKKPVSEWGRDSEYMLASSIVSNIKVVNDGAERGILLAKSLQNKLTFKEEERRKLFLGIPYARAKLEKLTKRNLFSLNFLE